MAQDAIVEVRNMVKNFGPTKALRGVDVTFYRGQIRGLVGENFVGINMTPQKAELLEELYRPVGKLGQ